MAQLQQRHILPRRISPSSIAVLDDAGTVPLDAQLLSLLERREPGTATWLFDDQMVRSWMDGGNGIHNLWLYGHDGAGKAVLAATLAEEMIRRAYTDGTPDAGQGGAVCFYLCRYEGAGSSDWDIMVTVVLQLAMQSEASFRELTTALSDRGDAQAIKAELQSRSADELGAILKAMTSHFGRLSVFLVSLEGVGAATQQRVLSLLGAIGQAPEPAVRVAVTGSMLDDGQTQLCEDGRFHAVFATGRPEDIRLYVRGSLARRIASGASALDDTTVRTGIENYIVNKSNGAWLWAVCELEAQCNLVRFGRWETHPVDDAPLSPPSQWPYGPDPEDMHPAIYPYRSYLSSVLAEGDPRTSFILNCVLKYVFAAGLWEQARLSVEEMCETLTSLLNHNPSSTWYSENNLPTHRRHPVVTEQDILGICGPLIHKRLDGSSLDIGHPSVIGFFRFYSPHLPETRDFLSVASPAKLMGETMDEFASVCEILEARGLFDAAEAMHRRVVRCEESACGPTHISTLARINNLGTFLLHRDRLDEAEAFLLRAKKGYENMDPAPTEILDRDSMSNTYNLLGILYKRRGEPALAEEHYLAALRLREDLYGRDSLQAARTAKNLGLLYVAMGPGRASDAAAMWERHLADVEAVLGAMHEEVITGVYDLALLYKNQRRIGEAGPLMERAVAGYERLRGRQDARTLDALFQLGQLCAVHGDLCRAETLFKEVVRGRERLYGEGDEIAEEARDSLAMVYRDPDWVTKGGRRS